MKAINEKDPEKQVALFEEYLKKFSGQRTPYEKYVLANLALIYSRKQEHSKVVEYGEKALSFPRLDDFARIQLYIALADSYVKLNQNLAKANRYAEIAVELSEIKVETKDKEKWIKILGGGYYVKASALKKLNNNSDALKYYIKAYEILNDFQILNDLKELGLIFYNSKSFNEAERAFFLPATILKDFASLNFYAKSLYHNEKIDKALIYFKEAFDKNPNSDTAYNIGIILARDESKIEKAIEYLAKAVVLNNGKKVEDARKLLEHLFFNIKKGTKKEFKELLKKVQSEIKKS
ncbi:hypothetical protein NLC82_03395 [Candidatus Aminicenantes bacterium AC-335-A11]|nr:hypothetical protein [SCandidatus Aminicenantes bacterium Aminicenantia_JdfR_composite]MCP2618444.1 hypothetical protein [Candidatus Aminicenantes bacterium AC-335-A11]